LKQRLENVLDLRLDAFRATSKRTRIETPGRGQCRGAAPVLSEQHPREQGLKQLTDDEIIEKCQNAFRATSKRTRIETQHLDRGGRLLDRLSEQHPREQGLKPTMQARIVTVTEHFQSNIQENKD